AFAVGEHQVVGPAKIAGDTGGLGDGLDSRDAEGQRQQRGGLENDGEVKAGAGFGVPGMTVTTLSGGLGIGDDDSTDRFGGGEALGGVDGGEAEDAALGGGGHASSRRKEMSTARAEWVMAPDET